VYKAKDQRWQEADSKRDRKIHEEVSSSFFASLNLFLFSIEHTRALAQERSFPSGIFFRRRSLFRVHPTRSAPYPFITAVWPTKHLFDPDGS
jgi:hypothetical protein